MKTINTLFYLTFIVVTAQIFQSCKRKDEVSIEEMSISTSDASTFREESDQVINEASGYIENSDFGKDNAKLDATVDSVTVTSVDGNGGAKTATAYPRQRKIILVFDNSESKDGQRVRSGRVILQLDTSNNKPKNWKDQNAELKITYENVKITRKSDNKYVVFNGNHIVKNTTGGRAIYAFITSGQPKVTHEVSGNMEVSFEDGTKRNWAISRKREVEFQKITVSSSNTNNIIESGLNRFGNSFTTSINDPIVIQRLTCTNRAQARVTDGRLTHTVNNRSNSIEFGYNVSGVKATTDCGKTSAKIQYTKRDNSQGEFLLTFYRNI